MFDIKEIHRLSHLK